MNKTLELFDLGPYTRKREPRRRTRYRSLPPEVSTALRKLQRAIEAREQRDRSAN